MTIAESTASKLCPDRMSVSPRFTAVLAYLCDQTWTDPSVTEMVETGDGLVMLASTYDPFFDEILGDASDLDRNLQGVSIAAGLTEAERAWLLTQRQAKVRRA